MQKKELDLGRGRRWWRAVAPPAGATAARAAGPAAGRAAARAASPAAARVAPCAAGPAAPPAAGRGAERGPYASPSPPPAMEQRGPAAPPLPRRRPWSREKEEGGGGRQGGVGVGCCDVERREGGRRRPGCSAEPRTPRSERERGGEYGGERERRRERDGKYLGGTGGEKKQGE